MAGAALRAQMPGRASGAPSGGGSTGVGPRPAAPPAQTRDMLGNVSQWRPTYLPSAYANPRTGPPVNAGEWIPMGNVNNAGGAPRAAAPAPDPGVDIDLSTLWGKIPPAPNPQVPVPPRETQPGLEDRRRAESLEFGRAKDRIGKIGRGSMKALESDFARRGLSGSGMEGKARAMNVGAMRGDLANVATEQALSALKREAEISDRNYAGNVTQRNQDIGITVGNANRTTDAHKGQLDFLQTLANLRARGARIY